MDGHNRDTWSKLLVTETTSTPTRQLNLKTINKYKRNWLFFVN